MFDEKEKEQLCKQVCIVPWNHYLFIYVIPLRLQGCNDCLFGKENGIRLSEISR